MESIITFVQSNQVSLMIAAFALVIAIFLLVFSGERVSTVSDNNLFRSEIANTPWLVLKLKEYRQYYGSAYTPEFIERDLESGRFYKRY